jgi:integrase
MGVTHFKKNRWVADWRENGKRFRKFFYNEKDAKIHFEKRKLDKLENKEKWGVGRGLTLKDMVPMYLEHAAHSNKPKTLITNKGLLKNILPLLGNAKLVDINLKRIEEYKIIRNKTPNRRNKDEKGNPVSKTTINREIGLIKHMLSLAVEWDKLEKNGLQFVKFYKEHKRDYFFRREQVLELVEKAPQPLRDIIIFALATGMRKGEILSLKWTDICYDDDNLKIQNAIAVRNTKSGESRIVPMNDLSVKIIKKRRDETLNSEYVFANPTTDKPFQDIKRQWSKLKKDLHYEEYHFHDLRHSFASYALDKGTDIYTLKDIMGHQKLITTEKYLSTLMERKVVMMSDFAGYFNDIKI